MPITINDCIKCGKLPDFDVETDDRDDHFSRIVLLCRCEGYHSNWRFGDPLGLTTQDIESDDDRECPDETEELKRAIENWNKHNPRPTEK